MGLLSFSPHIHFFLQKERTEQERPPPECSLGGREETASASSPLHPPPRVSGRAQGRALLLLALRCRGSASGVEGS